MFAAAAQRNAIDNWLWSAGRKGPALSRKAGLARAARSIVESLEDRTFRTVTPDPGSTFATAFNVGDLNGAVDLNDAVGPADGADIYRFSMPRAGMFFGRIRAQLAHAEIALIQEVTDPDGTVHEVFVDSRKANQDGPDGGFASGDLPGRFLTAGNYFMFVTARGDATPYLIRMTADFAGSSMSAARDVGSATDATFQDFVGHFPTPSLEDPFDFYKVKMDAAGVLRATFTLDNTDPSLFLAHVELIKDVNGNGVIDQGDILIASQPGTSGGVTRSLNAGTYFIRVASDLNFSNYRLHIFADYAGDTPATLRPMGSLDAGKSFNDFIDAFDDEDDEYSFSIGSTRPVNLVFLEANGGTSQLSIFKDSNNNGTPDPGELLARTDRASVIRLTETLSAGNYLVLVHGSAGSGTYQLFAQAQPDQAGNTLAAARNLGTINGLTTREDFVDTVDPLDFYRFTASSSGKVSAALFCEDGDADLALIRDTNNNGRIDPGETLATTQPHAMNKAFSKSIPAGNYFIRVSNASTEGVTKYLLEFHTDYAGDAPQSARSVGTLAGTKSFDDWASGPFAGVISDRVDLYKFNLTSTRTLTAKLTGKTAGQDLALQIFRDKNNNGVLEGNELVAATDHRDSPNEQLSRSLAAGTYFVRVVGINGSTNYHLALTA